MGKAATTEDFSVVQLEGSRSIRRRVKFYNLDMIISVGYRVNSKRGTQFRIWATQVLRDHLVKGYSVNLLSRFSAFSARSSRRRIFPMAVLGSDSMNTTCLGAL